MAGPPFRSFLFDCDSTLSRMEGVEEICAALPDEARAQVHELTERAMNGEVPLEEVYARRLELAAPTREQVERVGRLYVERIVPGTAQVVAALRRLGKTVGIVSGGLLPAVRVLAGHLGIPEGLCAAVPVRFAEDGSYAGFDETSPLWRSGGKAAAVADLPPDLRPVVFVGEGVTDLETKGIADLFVGFGGVVAREAVRSRADVFIEGPDLRPLLDVGLTAEERAQLEREET